MPADSNLVEASRGRVQRVVSTPMASIEMAARAPGRPATETVAYTGLALSTLCWAAAFIAGKVALAEMAPLAVAAWRYVAATLMLLPFAWRQRASAARLASVGRPLAIMWFCGGVLYPWLFLLALAHTSATNTSLLIALNPALTILLSPLVGERLERRQLAGVALALAGAVTVITRGDLAHLEELATVNRGDLLAVAAAACWACFNLASRRVVASLPPSLVNFAIYCGGAVALFAMGWREHPIDQLGAASPGAIGGVLAMALLSSVLAGQLFLVGVRAVGVNRTVVFVYLVPALTAVLSLVLLGEEFHPAQAAGGAAVLAGVYWTTRRRSA